MTVEFVIGIACIVVGLGAIGAGLYRLGLSTITEMLDGDDE